MDENYKTEDLSKYLTKQPKRKPVSESSKSSSPATPNPEAEDGSNPGDTL